MKFDILNSDNYYDKRVLLYFLYSTLFVTDFYYRHRSRPPSVDSFRQQSFAMPSVDRSLIQFTASPPVSSHHPPEMKKKGRDVLEEVRLASTKAETGNNVKCGDPCRPPIKIVLKPVKKCEMNPPLQKKCEIRHSSPVNASDGITRASVRSIPDFRYPPAIEKAVFKIRSPIPQRRSDAGCPPMIKATSTEISTVSSLLHYNYCVV